MQNYCKVWTENQGETIFKLSRKAVTLRQKVQHAVNIVTSWDKWISDEEYLVRLAQYKEKWMFSEAEYKNIITLPRETIHQIIHTREAIEILLSEWIITELQFEKEQDKFLNIKK